MTSESDANNVLNCYEDASLKYFKVHLKFGASGDASLESGGI